MLFFKKKMSDGCYYISIGAKAFGWTQLIPAVVTLFLFTATRVNGNWIWFWLGLYSYPVQYIAWCFQHYFQSIRPDPICQLYQTFAFPSLSCIYIGGGIGIFILYTYHTDIVQSWVSWLVMYIVGIVPPFILIYNLYNRWWEVLFSMGLGFVAAVMFVYVFVWFIRPKEGYLYNAFPFWQCGYADFNHKKFRKIHEGLLKLDGTI